MPYFEMHDEMRPCRLHFLQTKTFFWGFKRGNTHVENLFISITMGLPWHMVKCQVTALLSEVSLLPQAALISVFRERRLPMDSIGY